MTKKVSVPLRLPITLFTVAAASLAAAPVAAADTSNSSNWAGYAAHRHGVHFRTVSGAWRQPRVTCTTPNETFSAMWVGLGGFSSSSNALEQIGTEVDCSSTGANVSTAWFELVPAPSIPIRMTVRAGDVMLATVAIAAHHRVTLTLRNATRHRTFTKTVRVASIDDTSADWIVEAPSACTSPSACQTLPLADFGTASFGLALATSTTGRVESISGPLWGNTKITLAPAGRRYVTYAPDTPPGGATPSDLLAGGSVFSVDYASLTAPSAVPVPPTPTFATVRAPVAGRSYIRH